MVEKNSWLLDVSMKASLGNIEQDWVAELLEVGILFAAFMPNEKDERGGEATEGDARAAAGQDEEMSDDTATGPGNQSSAATAATTSSNFNSNLMRDLEASARSAPDQPTTSHPRSRRPPNPS